MEQGLARHPYYERRSAEPSFIVQQAFLAFKNSAERYDAWREQHPYEDPYGGIAYPSESITNNARLRHLAAHDLPSLLKTLTSNDHRARQKEDTYYWPVFVETALFELRVMHHLARFDAPFILKAVSELVLANESLLTSQAASVFEPLSREFIDRKDEFLAAYAACEPDVATSSAALLVQLLQYAVSSRSTNEVTALEDIRSSWLKASTGKSVLTELLLKYGPLHEHWQNYDKVKQQEASIWSTFSTEQREEVAFDSRRIARDAIGAYESDSSLHSIASIPLDTPLRINACPSQYIDNIYNYVTGSERWRRDEDSSDMYQDYEDFIEPFLSEEDRKHFYDLWTKSTRSEALAEFLLVIKGKQGYIPVQFKALANYTPPNTTLSAADRFRLAQIHRPAIRETIEHELDLSFTNLRIREQTQLVLFLSKADRPTYNVVRSVIRSHGINAARTFLALETDAKHGERILTFANQADPAVAARVFEAFARIADKIDLSAQDLAKHLYKDDGHEVDAERVRQELIKRGSRILLDAEKALAKDPGGASIVGELERYEADTVLFCAMMRSVSRNESGAFTLEAIRRLQLSAIRLAELPEPARSEHLQEYRDALIRNWEPKGNFLLNQALAGFERRALHADTIFYELRLQNRLVGILRFDTLPDGALYLGSVNITQRFQGASVGTSFLQECVDHVHEGRVIRFHALYDDPFTPKYINDVGAFVQGIVRKTDPNTGHEYAWYDLVIESSKPHFDAQRTFTVRSTEQNTLLNWIESETSEGRRVFALRQGGQANTITAVSGIPTKPD